MADGLERLITTAFWVEDFTPIEDSEYLDDRENRLLWIISGTERH